MVLSKQELIEALQDEVRILVHLCGKVQPAMVDYRPTAKQRSTIELLRYLTVMGPVLVPSIAGGAFLADDWGARTAQAEAKDLGALVADLAAQREFYAEAVGAMTDAQLREPIELFGMKGTRGAMLVKLVVSGHAAYRTQLFCYLKACGLEQLNTMNLWAGVDASM